MKTHVKSFLQGLLILSIASYTLEGHAQADLNDLLGTWTFTEGPSFARMPPDIKEYMDSVPEVRTQFFAALQGRTMTFLPNGEFVQTMNNGITLTGIWAVEGNILAIRNPEGVNFQHQIGELKSNRLVLLMPSSGEFRPVLPELYFHKN